MRHPDTSEKGKAVGSGNKPPMKEPGALRATVQPQPRYSVVPYSVKILTMPWPRNVLGLTGDLPLDLNHKWVKYDLAYTCQAARHSLDCRSPFCSPNMSVKARLVVPCKLLVTCETL